MDYLQSCNNVSCREIQTRRIKEAISALKTDIPLSRILQQINTGSELVEDDVFTLWDALQAHIPVTPQNEGIYQHLIDSAAFAYQLATLKPDAGVSPAKASFTAILHNAGMLLGPSLEYYRKAEISFLLATSLGIREDITNLMLPLELYLTPKNEEGSPRIPTTDEPNDPMILDNAHYIQETITPGQLLLEMARFLAKRNKKTGELMPDNEIVDLHLNTRSSKPKNIVWPSSEAAWKDIVPSQLAQSYAIFYQTTLGMLKDTGFDHATIARSIDQSWKDTDDRLQATSKFIFTEYLKIQVA